MIAFFDSLNISVQSESLVWKLFWSFAIKVASELSMLLINVILMAKIGKVITMR